MYIRLANLNEIGKRKSLALQNDELARSRYIWGMAEPRHDWYLREWLAYYGKRQADIVRDLDWNKAKVSLTVSGKQPYARDDINDVAIYLHLEPFEVLMHPDDAMAYRRMRDDALRIAKASESIGERPAEKNVSTG